MKLFNKVSILFASLALVMGAGLVGSNDAKEVKAEDTTVTWKAASGSLGTQISAVNGTAKGTIKTGKISWSYTRTLKKLSNNKKDNIQFNSKTGYIQLGSKNALENISLTTTTNIPGIVKSISIDCGSVDSTHALSITVGANQYLTNEKAPAWNGSAGSVITANGNASGTVLIDLTTDDIAALYIKSISITYGESSGTITSVRLDGDMSKKTYYVGDEWSLEGLYLTINWSEGNSTTLNLKNLSNEQYDLEHESATLGVTSLYIYGTYETFEFKKTIEGIVVLEKPTIKHAGTLEDPYTVADAILKAEETGTTATTEEFYVEGIVSSKYSSTNTDYDFIYKGSATFNISDDGTTNNEFVVFKIKNTGGSIFDDNYANNIIIGDTKVVVKGNIINYKGTTPEFVSDSNTAGELVSITSISAEQFINSWKELRANNKNSICEAILNDRESLNTLLNEYKELNSFAASIVDETIDSGDATIKRTIEYVTGILDGSQPTDGKYGINSGVIITSNYSIDSTSLIALFALLGIGAISAYYFIEKKKLSK